MRQDFSVKYDGRGFQIEVCVSTTEDPLKIADRLLQAARGPSLNATFIGQKSIPEGLMALVALGFHGFALKSGGRGIVYVVIINSDEELEVLSSRLLDAARSAETNSVILTKAAVVPALLQQLFAATQDVSDAGVQSPIIVGSGV